MKLLPARKWIRETFEGGVGVATVKKWVEKELIPGVVIDGAVFVDADKAALLLETSTTLKPENPRKTASGNSKVAQIIQDALDG